MKRSKSGFTLIELLIVVAIIGILAAIAVPNFLNAQLRARVARVQTDQKAIGTALGMYYVDHNAFPPFLNWPAFAFIGVKELTTPVAYMADYPVDPFYRSEEGHGVPETHKYVKMSYYNLDIMEKTGQARGNTSFGVKEYRQGSRWCVRSFGPNRAADYDSANDVFPEYDASNGLMSVGDIYRWGT
ncbi:MAG TPA: prepilin-type N-terminal cleavage/methylation domain-containing protein [bacterium]|nr:prepilin-type N-terminal cleavage/methylation domain-containing protein [Candidatus Omnitrophota bacterium]HOJ58670.1 prepilin-type N-terminal cleavage/methylation domain-containing protein [bacterium]HOL95273.1 prepilin-type N-terminal cleavage/methylation domain-containing protein [bacterium]HPP00281.1 prepilin-type N-terminal cleavage/methylation domain-containing protein [bacterium]HXK92427.1 prepilin-type N-terminal cleavage/methylation domain-containing protein [bacterium]